MKQKKSKGFRKALLMTVATVLVIAISVSATLAFLTDSTKERDNVFRGATNDIHGQIIEPSFTSTNTYYYSPGRTTKKDPMVQNDSTDDAVFTAVKLEFYIQVESGNDSENHPHTYKKVPFSDFSKYVTLNNLNIDFGNTTDNTTYGTSTSSDWKYNGTTDNAMFIYYNKSIAKSNNTPPPENYTNPGNDTTYPIFKSVTMSPYINIPQTRTTNTSGVENLKVANTTQGIHNATYLLNEDHQYEQEFQMCDIKIKISGYAVKADSAGYTLDPTEDDDAAIITALMDGLA